MRIETIIINRLRNTGKVHLSGWGTFYLNEQSVRWNHITNTAFPAGKYLQFSPNPSTERDTLLPEVMKSLGASMEVAEQWIVRKIKGWQNELDEGHVLMLPGLGSFPSQNRFQPEPGTFDAQSFGFVPVMIHKLEEPSALQSKVVASLKIASENKQSTLKAWQRAGAAAAVAALFGLGVMQSSVATQVAGWFTAEDTLEIEALPTVEPAAELPAITPTQPVVEEVEETPAPKAVEVVSQVHSKGYSVIVGSFREKSNADNYAAELAAQGLEVNLIPGSLRKVGIGHYQNRAEAVKAVSELKATVNSGAWIYAY
jgi:cell division septation protein DedD/nucleoid DNA-binding protein